MLDVYYRIRELHAEGHPIDNTLFERVGRDLKLHASGTAVTAHGLWRSAGL